MSEEHKTERTRSWQAASPAACGSELSLSSLRQQLSISRLHGEACNPRVTELLRLGGGQLEPEGAGGSQSLKDTQQQLPAQGQATGTNRRPQVPNDGNPTETSGKTLDGELEHEMPHTPFLLVLSSSQVRT